LVSSSPRQYWPSCPGHRPSIAPVDKQDENQDFDLALNSYRFILINLNRDLDHDGRISRTLGWSLADRLISIRRGPRHLPRHLRDNYAKRVRWRQPRCDQRCQSVFNIPFTCSPSREKFGNRAGSNRRCHGALATTTKGNGNFAPTVAS
jgi:hypothetical protein